MWRCVVGRGRPWTAAEDTAIRRAAALTLRYGISTPRSRRNGGDGRTFRTRLREVADKLDRSYAAVRMRASRIGAWSYHSSDTEDDIW